MVLLGKVKGKSPIFPCFLIEFDWKVAKHRSSVTPSCAEVSQLFYSLLCVPLLVCLQRKESLFLLCFAGKSVRSVDLIKQASEPGNWTIEDTGNTKIWERFEWFRLRVTPLWKGGKSAFPFSLISISASSVCLQDSIKVVRPPSQVPDGSSFTWCSLF